MTHTPDRIWINTSYIDSRSTIPVLPCNIGTSEQSLSLADEAQYLLATPAREAAPDMLEALEEIRADCVARADAKGLVPIGASAWIQLESAIAKATGGVT
jgi:hypothetical protein